MDHYPLIALIAAAYTAALFFGVITQKLRLSPIVGYLLAGIAIGPFTPGYVGDAALAHQLAEIGVILLMFGVGLHFHLKDLIAVRRVAIPGAIGQSLVATLLGVVVALVFDAPLLEGLVLGISMAVASTVVLIRGLSDNNILSTSRGHLSVGWLLVEDILTVIVLVLLPALAAGAAGTESENSARSLWISLPLALAKLGLLVLILGLIGSKVIPYLMVYVARLRSRELFTLTVLVMAIAVAAASYKLFGASMALGAFLAGMVVGQSPVSHQAAADALPLRDAFAVLFFASVGMLFDPSFLVQQPLLVLAGLGIILVGKPLAALVIVAIFRFPLKTGLTVAFGLAQIGEFSFILSEVARTHRMMDEVGHNLIVACAIVSITVNPFLFRWIEPVERFMVRHPSLFGFFLRGDASLEPYTNEEASGAIRQSKKSLAVIVGYGPVGRTVDEILREQGVETVIVDSNVDTISTLTSVGRAAIFGDATNIEVLREALDHATHLVITLPHSMDRGALIAAAKLVNSKIQVIVRARYLAEADELAVAGADFACFEEAESAAALAEVVLKVQGVDRQTIDRTTARIRRELVSDYF